MHAASTPPATLEIARALEHEEGHRQRTADDGDAERSHPRQKTGGRVEAEPGEGQIDGERIELTEQGADEQRSEKKAAAKARARARRDSR